MVTLPDSVRQSVECFIHMLNANNMAVRQAYIFGSYAKGQQTEWSDIDLALISDHFEGNRFYDHCKLSPYLIKADTSLEVHPFRPEDFTKDDPFVEEIIETGIRIV